MMEDMIVFTKDHVFRTKGIIPGECYDPPQRINDYCESLMQSGNYMFNSNLILPKGCKICRFDNNCENLYMIVEEEPQIRTITLACNILPQILNFQSNIGVDISNLYKQEARNPRDTFYMRLSFPYVIHKLQISSSDSFAIEAHYVYFRNRPIKSENDIVYYCNLNNVDTNSKLCLNYKATGNTIYDTVTKQLETFWNSPYNTDYSSNHKHYSKSIIELNSYISWAYYTKLDPSFILEIDWTAANTIMEILPKGNIFMNSKDSNEIRGRFEYAFNRRISLSKDQIDKFLNKTNDITEFEGYMKNIRTEIAYDDFTIYKGQEIFIKKNPFYILSIDKYIDSDTTKIYLSTEDINGNPRKFCLTNKFAYYLQEEIKTQTKTSNIINNDQTFYIGDTISCHFKDSDQTYIGTLEKIQNDILNNTIIQLDTYVQLYTNNLNITKLNTEFIEAPDGRHIKLGDVFEILNIENGDMYSRCAVKLQSINYNDNNLYINFQPINSSMNHRANIKSIDFFNPDNVLYSDYFHFNGHVCNNTNHEIALWNNNIIIPQTDSDYKFNLSVVELIDKIVNDQKLEIIGMIESTDLNWKIDDLVYCASLGSLCTIHSFEKDSNNNLEILLKNKTTNEINRIPYLFHDGKIHLEELFQAYESIGNYSVGDKIKATTSDYCGFPKKDTNIIKAFIKFGDFDLVVLSNNLTLYSESLEDFNIIKPTNKNYNFKTYAPAEPIDISSKLQLFDLGRVDTGLIFYTSHLDRRYYRLFSKATSYTYNKDIKINQIQIPRIFKKDWTSLETYCRFLILPNGIIKSSTHGHVLLKSLLPKSWR